MRARSEPKHSRREPFTYDVNRIFRIFNPLPLFTVTLTQPTGTLVCFWSKPPLFSPQCGRHMWMPLQKRRGRARCRVGRPPIIVIVWAPNARNKGGREGCCCCCHVVMHTDRVALLVAWRRCVSRLQTKTTLVKWARSHLRHPLDYLHKQPRFNIFC